jgi:hypothetical protein
MDYYHKGSNSAVYFDAENRLVRLDYYGHTPEQENRDSSDKSIELVKEKGVSKLLIDIRKMTPFSKEMQGWYIEDWLPRAVAAGVKSEAIVVPTSALSRLAVNATMNKVNTLEFVYFDSVEAAQDWLNSRAD